MTNPFEKYKKDGNLFRKFAKPDDDRAESTLGEGILDQFTSGVAFGFGDELTALESALLGRKPGGGTFDLFDYGGKSFPQRYEAALEAERSQQRRFEEERPGTAAVSEIAGALVVPSIGVAKAGAPLSSAMLRGAGVGATEGALYGAGTGEGTRERVSNALKGAVIGAPFGALAPAASQYVGGKIDDAINKRRMRRAAKSAPSPDELRRVSKAAFARADATGGLPRSELRKAAPGVVAAMRRKGMRPGMPITGGGGTPHAYAATMELLQEAADVNPNIKFTDMDALREVAKGVANKTDAHESMLGNRLMENIDKVIDDLDPNLGKTVREARSVWGRLQRNKLIESAINRAELASSGFENGLRIEFTRILKNPRMRRGFGESEIWAMENVVKGTKVGNLLKKVGRMFGLGRGAQSNALMAGLSGAGAYSAMGPAGPVLTGISGKVATDLATTSTGRKAELARALTAAGGVPLGRSTSPTIEKVVEALTRRSGRGAIATKDQEKRRR